MTAFFRTVTAMFFIAPDLSARDRQPELMDQPGLAAEAHHDALAGLATINRLSFAARALWRPIAARMQAEPKRTWRLLDVACGAGDVPVALARRAARAGLRLSVAGCDVSETAVACARRRAEAAGIDAEFFALDVLRKEVPYGYDFVTCSLFLHHLEMADVVALLRSMGRAAGTLAVVSDLRRTHIGYALAHFGTRVLSRSRIVQIDGPLSVRAAFTMPEMWGLAEKAGLGRRVSIRRSWPQRFLMTIAKDKRGDRL
jgi:2-polyprenyl-3-methyl-5-hydroxy-6-metoxy-1,4-benzoquinol methylase